MTLTPTEQSFYDLLKKGSVVERNTLLHAGPSKISSRSNVVDVHIKNLRKKLQKQGQDIETVRCIGYKLAKVKSLS